MSEPMMTPWEGCPAWCERDHLLDRLLPGFQTHRELLTVVTAVTQDARGGVVPVTVGIERVDCSDGSQAGPYVVAAVTREWFVELEPGQARDLAWALLAAADRLEVVTA